MEKRLALRILSFTSFLSCYLLGMFVILNSEETVNLLLLCLGAFVFLTLFLLSYFRSRNF